MSTDRTKILLLAAGLGTRLRPLTDTTPKCLVPVAGRPLLDYWFDRFADAGLRDVRINTHHLPEQVRRYIRRVNETGRFKVVESWEPMLLGSAGTVRANRGYVRDGEQCLIVYADNLSDVDLGELLRFHAGHSDPLTMMLFHTPVPHRCGIAQVDSEGVIREFVEKPRRPVGDLANGGIYVVDADAYREMADMEGVDLGFDILPRFVGRMRGWTWNGYHRDIGTPEALEGAEQDVRSGRLVAGEAR